ncbi:MAG: CDP-diacylglycerol O-phosphatidyltransferase [Rickettsiales bacterium]|nr:CDP-diacylglycerol O-phosphatidyltransferase [Rickettsiales bacterium]
MKKLSIVRLIPNIVTFISLTLGLTSIKFAIDNKWEISVSLIVFASFLDNIDGKLARLFKSNSNFGIELDSLSDFLSFGIAPALIVFFWTLDGSINNSWAYVIFYAICSSSRLAKFNISSHEKDIKNIKLKFFQGISTPAAAGLVLLPMMIFFRFENDFFINPILAAIILICSAILMNTNIPTYSFKGLKIEKRIIPIVIIFFAGFISLLITDFWLAMILFISFYYLSIPVAYFHSKRLE